MSCPEIGLQVKVDKMGQRRRKREVVEEYLRGGVTLRELGARYQINFRTIHRWVKEAEAGLSTGEIERAEARRSLVAAGRSGSDERSDEVKRLGRELEEARLYNELLNAMIDIAEERFEIPIRKKRGAKQ